MCIKSYEPVLATGLRRYATHAGPNGLAPDAFSFESPLTNSLAVIVRGC